MEYRDFGRSGIKVSSLGFGAGHLGDESLTEKDILQILELLEAHEVNLIDTARGYGLSEERLGRYLRQRERWVLSTKIGYGLDGFQDWTAACIAAGIEAALMRLQTDYLDIVHLHSCPLEILQQGEVIEALLDAVAAGKVRVPAYSGENEALSWAIQSGEFASIQCSVNLCDQRGLERLLPSAQARGLGVIAKRPLANAFWRFESQPYGDYAESYWLRWQQMALETALPMDELALRFSLSQPGVHSAIVGTNKPEHLLHNLKLAAQGPLPAELNQLIRERFRACGQNWPGEV